MNEVELPTFESPRESHLTGVFRTITGRCHFRVITYFLLNRYDVFPGIFVRTDMMIFRGCGENNSRFLINKVLTGMLTVRCVDALLSRGDGKRGKRSFVSPRRPVLSILPFWPNFPTLYTAGRTKDPLLKDELNVFELTKTLNGSETFRPIR